MTRVVVSCVAACTAALVTPAADTALPRFTDITRQAGIDVRHVNGASAAKHLVETMGSGGLFVDYDGDAWMDVFLVDGGSPADAAAERRARHRLYRNRGDGTFEDATRASAITHRGYGMGACAGDYDGDGRVDLYVTNYGPNALFRNRGNGSFADVTAATGAGGSSPWSASCAFADLDRDGDLDLFVTSYVDAGPTETPFCGDARRGTRVYCHPLNFGPLPNAVLRNDGGVFTDVSAPSGIADRRGNGLGVVVADYDEDGWPDVFVANDSVPNFLFRNRGNWRFEEVGVAAGVAFATDGQARAGMGIDAGDYDGDLRLDLVITNLDFERHTLHRGLEQGLFADATSESGIGFATLPFVGFGALFLDYDNDSRLDIAIANGHIFDNAPQYRAGAVHAQRNLLLRNTTLRRFVEVGRTSGPGFALEKVSRGLAAADIDNDGDLDLLVTNNGQAPDLLRNDGGSRGNALLIRLAGRQGNHDAVGASVRVTAGSRTQLRTVKAGSSYLSQSDPRVHVGLGTAAAADRVEVRWPSGRLETLRSVASNQLVTVREGEGIVGRVPLRR